MIFDRFIRVMIAYFTRHCLALLYSAARSRRSPA